MDIRFAIFLSVFFKFFRASLESTEIRPGSISGTVLFDDNEKQSFIWSPPEIVNWNSDVLVLAEFLLDNGLTTGDKITVPMEELLNEINKTGWPRMRIENAINSLLAIRVYMVDNGVRTDSFFVHF